MNELYRGEIYYIEPYLTEGSEQRAGRPAIIVSNDMANNYSPIVEVVYLTTQPKTDLPTHVTIRSTNRESIALCEQITSISKDRIGDYVCMLTSDELQRVNTALLISLALEPMRIETSASSPSVSPTDAVEPNTKKDAPIAAIRAEQAVSNTERAVTDTKLATERDIFKELYESLLARVLERGCQL